jgi:hypothetical protein
MDRLLELNQTKLWERQADEICHQIGTALFNRIINSKEYDDLYDINEIIFDLVDKLKADPESVSASEVNNNNYKRYLYKKELQRKFFNNDLSERKIGY